MKFLLSSVLGITIVIIIVDYYLVNGTIQTKLGTIVRSTWPREEPPIWKISNIFWEFRDSPHNMPLIYHENQNPKFNSKCGAMPTIDDIEFHNSYWQHFGSSQANFYIYSAFIDDRLVLPQVIILASVFNLEEIEKTRLYCQLWYESSKEPLVTEANFLRIQDISYLIMCNITQSINDEVPVSVSLVEKECNKATNNIRIFYEKPKEKEDIGVCFVSLNFPNTDMPAIKLVESILLTRLTGVSKMFFYPRNIHPKAEKVLLYFSDKGYISTIPFQHPGHIQNLRMANHDNLKFKVANEMLALNDCLYRNMYSYKYLVMLDVDEIIIPKKQEKLINIVEETIRLYRAKNNNATLDMISTRNYYFTDIALKENGGVSSQYPEYLHMMQHVYRSKDTPRPMKWVYNASSTAMAWHHQPLLCIHDKVKTKNCNGYDLPPKLGVKYHYRFECRYYDKKMCTATNATKDTTIRKYWPELKQEVETTLAEIGWDILPARVLEEHEVLDNKTAY